MAIAFPKPPDAPVNIIFFSLNAAIVVDEHSGNKTMRSCPCMYVCVLLLFSADRTINFQIRADVRHKMGKKPTNNLIEAMIHSFLPIIIILYHYHLTDQNSGSATLPTEEEGTSFLHFTIAFIFSYILKSVLRFLSQLVNIIHQE